MAVSAPAAIAQSDCDASSCRSRELEGTVNSPRLRRTGKEWCKQCFAFAYTGLLLGRLEDPEQSSSRTGTICHVQIAQKVHP